MSKGAENIIRKLYKQVTESNADQSLYDCGLIEDNIFKWKVIIFGPKDTDYEGGMYTAELIFPENYPNKPPVMRFKCKMWHPNISSDGKVCISILHEGKDEYDYESEQERWKPTHSAETIILSVISLLSDPNIESPMNIEAAKMYRENPDEYKRMVRRYADKSHEFEA